MEKVKMHPSVQKEIRAFNYDELLVLLDAVIYNKKMHKDDKPVLIAYIEMRIKKLQKQKDYNNKSMPDHEYVAKWGSK
jgi:hypothetical protein